MSLSPEAIQALICAGVTAEQLGAAVLADQARDERIKAEKRAKDAKRKADARAAARGDVRDCPRTSADTAEIRGHERTAADPSLDKEGPPDPLRKLNPPGDISPRTREAVEIAVPKADRAKPRKAVPDDWSPTDAGRRHAIERGMPPEAIEEQVERFRDHHTAKGSTFASVDAAWRTWAGNFNTYRPQTPRLIHDRSRAPAGLEKLDRVAAAMRAARSDPELRRSPADLGDPDGWGASGAA